MNFSGVTNLNKRGICLVFGILLVFVICFFSGWKTPSDARPQPPLKVNLRHLLQVAIKAAENGGNEVAKNKDVLKVQSKGKSLEGLDDRVTTADYLSHCAMMKTLKNSYPSLTIISEETVATCDNDQNIDFSEILSDPLIEQGPNYSENLNDITVWIDPLDATYEYTEKLYDYVTTMVCIAVRGRPIIGVIHKPFSKDNQTFWAWGGNEPHSNIRFKWPQKSDKKKIIISRSHSGKIRDILSGNIENYDVIVAAGAGYKVLQVVTGQANAYLHVTAIKKWDICAGNAIVNAARGKMTTISNDIITYYNDPNHKNDKGLVVALGEDHQYFIDLFKQTEHYL